MGRSQREKGKRGERQACEALEALTGIPWERSARQSRALGGQGCPDLVPTSGASVGLHPEVKVGKAPPALPALEQAIADASPGCLPFALVRRDRGEWVVVVRASEVVELVRRMGGGA
jgi:hypothetical protein